MNLQAVILFVPMTGLFVVGATTLRLFAASDHWPMLAASLVAYAVGSLLMAVLMKHAGFAVLMSVTNTVQLALIVLIGIVAFNDRLNALQFAGVGLALISVALMVLPSRSL